MNTISAAWALAVKDLKGFVRDRTALVLSLLVPIALVTVFGWIMAYAFGGGSGGMPQVRLHIADLAQTESSKEFAKQVDATDMVGVTNVNIDALLTEAKESGSEPDLSRLEKLVRNGDAHHVLVIPQSYDQDLANGDTPAFRMIRDPGRSMEDQVVQIGIMQAAISELGGNVFTDAMDRMLEDEGMNESSRTTIRSWMTDIGSEIGSFFEAEDSEKNEGSSDDVSVDSVASRDEADVELEETDGAETSAGGFDGMFGFMSNAVPLDTIDVEPPNRSQKVTYQQAQSVAGMTVMMLLFALTSCGSVLLTEREEGTLRRLFAQPISRNAILLGKFFFVFMVGIAQMCVLFVYGEWMFQVGLFNDPVTLIVLSLTWVAAGGAFGMFLASVSKSTKQAESLASLLILMMAALGGCWFPLQLMKLPTVLDTVCKSTMTYWAMTGFQGMLWNQLAWYSPKTLTALGWQWGWAIVLASAAVFFFRRNYCRG